ncbi:MAG: alpha/beta fold hydrolase [Gammaproteobacteria bacterium]|nr:alpha/beta fold hydrolase [Gammaproteobacteria bacterium]
MPLSSNGTAYLLSGEKHNPVVVLIHGLGVNNNMWRDFIPRLSQQFQVLTYDLFGHGESAEPLSVPSLTMFSDQLKSLLEFLGIEVASIVGYSLGGMINRRFTMDYPERVQSLVILNSPHERSREQQQIIESRVKRTSKGGPAATMETSLKRWFTPEFVLAENDVVNDVREWILSNNPLWYTQCREVLANGVCELIRPNPPISTPTLVMTCENDTGSTPAMAHAIAKEITGSQVQIIPHLLHLGLMEKPTYFLDPIENFLKISLARHRSNIPLEI